MLLPDGSYASDLKCEGGTTEVVDATKIALFLDPLLEYI